MLDLGHDLLHCAVEGDVGGRVGGFGQDVPGDVLDRVAGFGSLDVGVDLGLGKRGQYTGSDSKLGLVELSCRVGWGVLTLRLRNALSATRKKAKDIIL